MNPLTAKNKLSVPERYYVEVVDKKIAQEIIIKQHYLARRSPCMQAFCLRDREQDNRIVGILMFGVSHSSTLLKVCGSDESKAAIELTRLWVEDGTQKNAESFFVAQCLRRCCREIVIALSDISAGHYGGIYQSCNFHYLGITIKFKDPRLKNSPNRHHQSFSKGMKRKDVLEKYGPDVEISDRTRKHKYVFINARSKKRRGELLRKLRLH